MPGQERLTDRNPLTAETASNNLKFYVVDEDSTDEHPDGDSFQVSKSELIEILGISALSTPDEEAIIGNVITSTTVNTTYTLDFTAASVWILQSTGTFSFVNGAFATNEKSIMKVVFLSGENAFTTGLGWVKDPDSDDYDGTKWNRIVLEIIRTAEFGFIVRYSIKNLEAVV